MSIVRTDVGRPSGRSASGSCPDLGSYSFASPASSSSRPRPACLPSPRLPVRDSPSHPRFAFPPSTRKGL
jgi:hypothetical protein